MSEKSLLKRMVHLEKSGIIIGGRIICTEKDKVLFCFAQYFYQHKKLT